MEAKSKVTLSTLQLYDFRIRPATKILLWGEGRGGGQPSSTKTAQVYRIIQNSFSLWLMAVAFGVRTPSKSSLHFALAVVTLDVLNPRLCVSPWNMETILTFLAAVR